ncbi:MAG: 6-carboxytetrahydropterin synthase [Crocinitomicaceae bacterium]
MSSQKVRVTKKFQFDMAHALFGYDGPCKNIHGHTYYLEVTLMGWPNVEEANPKQGMVLDFGDLKAVIKKHILEPYDHALVLNKNAGYAKSGIFTQEFEKVVSVPFQPTCENLVIYFVEKIRDEFPSSTQLIRVRLDETPTSYAEWHLSDNI